MTEWMGLALVFVITVVVILGFYALLQPRNQESLSDEPARRWFGPFTPAVAGMLPTTDSGRRELQQELWLAGYYQPAALENFLSMRALLALIPVIAGLFLAWQGPQWILPWAFFGGLGLGILGFAIPRVALRSQGRERAERIRSGMPVLMDTMGLCLSTGAGLLPAFARSGDSIRRGYPDLSRESRIVTRQAELRSMEHALEQWRTRIPIPELASFVFLLTQGDRLGTDVAKGLWELSTSYRVNTRQRAESAANRLNFTMLFPTVLCLLSAAGIVLVGPSVLQAVNEGKVIREELRQAEIKGKEASDDVQQSLDRMQDGPRPAPPVPVPEPVEPRPAL